MHIQIHPSIPDIAQLHLTIISFTLTTARIWRRTFDQIKNELSCEGIKKIVGIKTGDCESWSKLMKFCGFNPVDITHPVTGKYIEMEV